MDSLVMLFVHLIVLCLVFALLYWVVTLICGVLPPPIQAPLRVALLILLALIALSFLLGEAGVWGTWGYGYSSHHGILR